MLLHEIRLKNILSFGPNGQQLVLKPLNVIVGPNGSGKSNVIDAIGLLRAAPVDLHEAIRKGGGVTNWIWRGSNYREIAEIEVHVSHANHDPLLYRLNFVEDEQRFQIHSEYLGDIDPPPDRGQHDYFDATPEYVQVLHDRSYKLGDTQTAKIVPSHSNQSVFSYVKGPAYPELTHIASQLQQIQLYRNWVFGPNSPLRNSQPSDLPNDHLCEDGSNLGLVLNRVKRDHPKSIDRMVNELQQVYEGINGFDVSIEAGSVQLFIREGDINVPATRISDGTLRYICLLAVLCRTDLPPLICIEEPELGLHPDLLPAVADLLRDASERSQLIVTTHSDVLVDQLTDDPECVIICEKHEGQTELKRLNKEELVVWLEDYRLGELWSKGVLGGNRW